jgi:hypothetical protein
MNAQTRLNVIEVTTRNLAKGPDTEVDILVMYIDLAFKSISEMRKKAAAAKKIVDDKNAKAIEEGNKKIKEEANKKKETLAKANLKDKKVKVVKPKEVVESVKKEDVKDSDPKVN